MQGYDHTDLGCCKMHFPALTKAIVFSSMPLGMLMNICDFRRIPKIFRPPPTAIYPADPFSAYFVRIYVFTAHV